MCESKSQEQNTRDNFIVIAQNVFIVSAVMPKSQTAKNF